MRILHWIAALIAAALGTYILGVIVNSQFVMNAHGVPISFSDRLNMTAFDVSNMYLYLVIIVVTFLLGFLIAALVRRFVPSLAGVAYPVAGAAAIATALGLMWMQFQTIPISGARSTAGFLAQVVAGGVGGWIFAKIVGQRADKQA
ncbi:hypothetical protein [Qipengyuania aquimaris]|uniref:Uncharacterized protein n=1 Tax=Qipengyuania aquimaris TaxID=255984 RepID=A0A9Q3XCJ8_9SPHN|nr:hypothetical protein [Qipengyuania aquimaris]MBY6218122.1 hypothetical protein [Qipengyuania aquimaris]